MGFGADPVRGHDPRLFRPALPHPRPARRWRTLSVNFPSLPGFGGRLFAQFKDRELALACVRAWNDYILDEWCREPCGSLRPDGHYPDLGSASRREGDPALRREGCACGVLRRECRPDRPPIVAGATSGTRSGRLAKRQTCRFACMLGRAEPTRPSRPTQTSSSRSRSACSARVMGSITFMLAPPCHKFPGLKLVWSEGGVGWIPAALERADRQVKRRNAWAEVARHAAVGDLRTEHVGLHDRGAGRSAVPPARWSPQDSLGDRLPALGHPVATGGRGR